MRARAHTHTHIYIHTYIHIGVKRVPHEICGEEGNMHVKPNTSIFFLHCIYGFDIIEGSLNSLELLRYAYI
jgi:hypothetical protein